ncbi:hypothetical protein V5799_023332 [Amblyomma americanum]|uniref:Uncharacterized protein n=1 Tax=Amblyomma americanum TaxID=6943 RepID=A0AAQ4FJU8_AMBAM
MARKLYNACVKGGHSSSKEDVRNAVKKVLDSVGIKNWPLHMTSEPPSETYVKIVETTGLRPFATIVPVPDREKPIYIVSMNELVYHMGASADLLDGEYIKEQYNLGDLAGRRISCSLFLRT